MQSYSAFQSDADATLVGDEAERRAADVLIVTLNGIRLDPKTLPVDFFKRQHLVGKKMAQMFVLFQYKNTRMCDVCKGAMERKEGRHSRNRQTF